MNVFADGLFRDQVALVTGGGTGIGAACARELGRLGATVVIAARSPERLEAAAQALRAEGVDAFGHPVDIRDLSAIDALLDAIDGRYGRLDILVNNAGGQFPMPAIQLEPKGWDAVIRNNLSGTFYITQAAARRFFVPARSGRIVNIIANIERGFPGMVHTGAARAGVDNLTKTLAIEWVSDGIRINAVAPGIILSSGMKQYPEALVAEARRHIPMKRLGTVEEVAHLVVFLASDAASYMTGETVYIDGGARLWGAQWPIPDPVEGSDG